jgi:chlorite dismutase
LKIDPQWRRLDDETRLSGRDEFAAVIRGAAPDVSTFAYSTLGLKRDTELMLWWKTDAPDRMQDTLAALLRTGLGRYCEVAHSLWGLTRPSIYTKRRTAQEQALDENVRLRYLIVYPFVKTIEWYLMSRDARQGMMNEHMRVGHEFDDVRQVLLYTTGLDDQEFIVAYETDALERHQDLVIALRSTEARRYTLRDTPIFTAVHRPLDDVLALL